MRQRPLDIGLAGLGLTDLVFARQIRFEECSGLNPNVRKFSLRFSTRTAIDHSLGAVVDEYS